MQVVTGSSATSTTTSTSFVDITSATVDITPQSTSNKVLVIWTCSVFYSLVASTNVVYYQIMYRDASALAQRYYSIQNSAGGIQGYGELSMITLDSPSSTSALTYKIQHRVSSASSTAHALGLGNWIIALVIAG